MSDGFDYPVKLERAGDGGFTVTFPDVPEAITEGDTVEEALMHASDALESALEFYTDANNDLPRPSRPKGRSARTVRPSPLGCAKLAVYQAMRDQRVGKAELARRLGWHLPQVDRVLDLHHASRLDHVTAALGALGFSMRIEISKAA